MLKWAKPVATNDTRATKCIKLQELLKVHVKCKNKTSEQVSKFTESY